MNVLLVDKSWGMYGGPEEVLSNLVKEFKEFGVETRMVVEESPMSLLVKTRENVDWADIVVPFTFPSPLIASFFRKPVVWICYDAPETLYRWYKVPFFIMNRKIWGNKRKRKYIVCSNIVDSYSIEVIYRTKVDYITNGYGVDYDFYSKGVRSNNNTFRIIQVGTILRFKNQLKTLDIFGEFIKKVPEAELVLAGPKVLTGSGPKYWELVNEKIRVNGWKDKVILTGHISREKVRELYYNSSVYLHPVEYTGGWLPPFEALSSGLPVVSSERFFGSNLLRPFGIVSENYVDALLDIYSNREKYIKKAEEGRKWIRENYTFRHYAKRLINIFGEVLIGKS